MSITPVDALLDYIFCITAMKSNSGSRKRRFFHSFSVKLPCSRCLRSAADLKFVTSCGQNWFPARIPFEQRGPLWRTSCHVCLTEQGKGPPPPPPKTLDESYTLPSLSIVLVVFFFVVFFPLRFCLVPANFLTIQPRPWNRGVQTDRWLIRSAWTSWGKPGWVCSLRGNVKGRRPQNCLCVDVYSSFNAKLMLYLHTVFEKNL